MKTLVESILDADFPDRDSGLDIIIKFTTAIEKCRPKNESEAYTYWIAIRKGFAYILKSINSPGDTKITNKLKLQMLEKLLTLPGKVEVPYYMYGGGWSTSSTEDKYFLQLITKHYKDIEENNFNYWASATSSAGLMSIYFDEDNGYEPDPSHLPSKLFGGFDDKLYKLWEKKIYNISVQCVDALKRI